MHEELERTGWIHASVKPVRDGVYEVRFEKGFHISRLLWRVNKWYYCGGDWDAAPFDKKREAIFSTVHQGLKVGPDECWRGLTLDAYNKAKMDV